MSLTTVLGISSLAFLIVAFALAGYSYRDQNKPWERKP